MRARLRLVTFAALSMFTCVVGGCAGRPTRPAPAPGLTAAPPAAPATAKQPNWLERSTDATWQVITLPVRALTPSHKPPAAAAVETPDPPAELVLVPAHGPRPPAAAPAETQP